MEMDIAVKFLDALRGYRLSFHHLDDHRIDTYVVSNRRRVPLSKLLLSLQGNFRVLLGSFSEDEIREAIRDTIIHQSRALDDKYAKLMERWDRFESTPFKDSIDWSFNGFIRNPKTNRMIKVGSQRYKDQFPESKKKRGLPCKCIWGGDPLAYAGSMFKDVDSMDREFVDNYLDKVSLRCIMLIYDDQECQILMWTLFRRANNPLLDSRGLVEEYNHHPLCNNCATRIDLWNEYIWDHNNWVDTIDL